MEIRLGTVTASRAGGTAGAGAKTYKLTLPSAWVSALELNEGDRRVALQFDGERITLSPVQRMEQYRAARLGEGHRLLAIRYYNGEQLCTLIYADETAHDLRAENYTDLAIKTAFGRREFPTWDDLQAFLESRCIPRDRAGLREYLEALGLTEYDPLAIIARTQGRMAEDQQWMEIEVLA